MTGLEIEAWVGRRTFIAARVCQNIVTNLVGQTGQAPAEEVAEGLSVMLGKTYDARDVRMLMGSSESADETAALMCLSDIFKRFGKDNIDQTHKRLVDEGYDPLWVGYAATFLKQAESYASECRKLVNQYTLVLKELPDVHEGQDLTEVVAFPKKPNQSPVINEFIDTLVEHFTILPGVVMVPNTDNWLASDIIVVRTVENEAGVVVTVPTPKGVIVLNAMPV
jgi:hypothetical protein